MVLAGYGGASLLFFGVSPTDAYKAATSSNTNGKMPLRRPSTQAEPTSFSDMMAKEKTAEEAQLTHAIDASEAEAAGDAPFTFPGIPSSSTTSRCSSDAPKPYSWWDVLLGKHDREIFELSAAHDHGDESKDRAGMKETAERKKKEMKEKIKSTAVGTLMFCRCVITPSFCRCLGMSISCLDSGF
jgi:sn1-specific diacylglycerol lipase